MSKWNNIFIYRDGDLFWRIKPSNNVNVGDKAGVKESKGYMVVSYSGKRYYQHRIIYELFNGAIPDGMFIDHINREPSDNRIENLRIVTPTGNLRNHGKRGFRWKKNKWEVSIRVNGIKKYIGRYICMLDARAAYLRSQKEYWYE